MKYYCSDPELNQLYKKHESDAGLDICSAEDAVILGVRLTNTVIIGEGIVSTGLHVHIPVGYVGIIKSRSGISFLGDIEVGAGVIDSGYTGEIKIKLYNYGNRNFCIKKGDRIAQILTIPCNLNMYEKVNSLEELGTTDRNNKGLGSSGI